MKYDVVFLLWFAEFFLNVVYGRLYFLCCSVFVVGIMVEVNVSCSCGCVCRTIVSACDQCERR